MRSMIRVIKKYDRKYLVIVFISATLLYNKYNFIIKQSKII